MSTYAKDFVIKLGLVTTRGKLLTMKVTPDKATKFTSLCPVCKNAECKQYLFPTCGHTPKDAPGFTKDQVIKGQKNADDKWIEFTADDEKVVKESKLPKNVMDLNVHPIAQVEQQTRPSGNMYWFEPDSKTDDFYSLLAEELAWNRKAFVAVVNTKTGEKMCQLVWHAGGIVVQELLRPNELEAFEANTVRVDADLTLMVDELIAHMSSDFNPVDYDNDQGEKIRELLEGREPVKKPRKASNTPARNTLLDELEEALEQARKKPAKKPAKKRTKKVS